MQINAALQQATDLLEGYTSSPRLDAEILLSHFIRKNRTYLFTWPEKEIAMQHQQAFNAAVDKRKNSYPVAYIIGYQEFWSLKLEVSEAVLIPRADTELLVETALDKLEGISNPCILELGTGSGAIALALALERPDSKITAIDISLKALDIASKNKETYDATNVCLLHSNWFKEITQTNFDLIISNPPYIDPLDEHMSTGIRFEPRSALCADDKGLADLIMITAQALNYLKKSGWLMLEHGFDQGGTLTDALKKANYQQVACLKDLSQNDRITIGQY